MKMTLLSMLVIFIVLAMQSTWIASQPADLGALNGRVDIPIGIISQTSPAETERLPDLYVMAKLNYTYFSPDGKNDTFAYPKEVAKYGEGQIFDISSAKLVHITNPSDPSDHRGCTNDTRDSFNQSMPTNQLWIALIQRGDCKFEEKVQHVHRQGAIGAIIYNHHDAENLDKMKIEDRSRNITAVFTNKTVGERLAALIDANCTVYIAITRGRYIKPIPSINRTSVLFVSISFIVLMIISFVWLVFYYVQRFRYLQTKDRKSRQLCTVAKRVIAKIPTKSGRADDEANDSDSDCCAICIEPYRITDVIRVLPCKHEFHKCCIDPWLLEHRTCPMCKMDILKHYGFVVGAQNQIINLNEFILAAQANSNAAGPEPTATITQTNRTMATQNNTIREQPPAPAIASPLSAPASAGAADGGPNNRRAVDGERCPRGDYVAITQSHELLAISSPPPPPPPSQSINCSHSINHSNCDNSHLAMDTSRSSCSGNCCNNRGKSVNCICNKLSSANYIDADCNARTSGIQMPCNCSSTTATTTTTTTTTPTTAAATSTTTIPPTRPIIPTIPTMTTVTSTTMIPVINSLIDSTDCTANNNSSHHISK